MTDIDWDKVYAARIGACCRRAGTDFHLTVTAPFSLQEGVEFIAHFPGIGSNKGILVCLASQWEKLQELAHHHGYTCVGILPETCSHYDRLRWEGTIREWMALTSIE